MSRDTTDLRYQLTTRRKSFITNGHVHARREEYDDLIT